MNETKIYISPTSIIVFFASILAMIFLYHTKDVMLLLFASFIIASALNPTVDWMSKKLPRGLVVTIIYLIGLIIILTILIPFISIIIEQSQAFIARIPAYWEHLIEAIDDIEIIALNSGVIPDYAQVLSNITEIGQNIISKSIGFTINFFAGIAGAFTLAIIILFLLLDKEPLKKGYLALFPVKNRKRANEITGTIAKKVGGYVRGQLFLMLAVGILTALGLWIAKIEFPLLLGIVAGILEIIPIVGPIVAAVPGVIVGLAQGPMFAIWALLVYIIVQRIENHILTPMILGKFLDMHPLIIIIAILLAASTLGVFGVILSPAIAAVIYVLAQELYIKKLKKEEQKTN